MKSIKQKQWLKSNPMLRSKKLVNCGGTVVSHTRMTVQGAINKTFFGLVLALLSGWLVYSNCAVFLFMLMEVVDVSVEEAEDKIRQLFFYFFYLPLFLMLLLTIIAYVKPVLSGYLFPIYAITNGILLGFVSSIYGILISGIINQALLGTFIVFVTVLSIYKMKLIKLGNYWRSRIRVMVCALSIFYAINCFYIAFTGSSAPFSVVFDDTLIGILFSTFVIIFLSFVLLADLERTEKVAQIGVPRYIEWYCAMGIMATVFWIYLEILSLLSKLVRR